MFRRPDACSDPAVLVRARALRSLDPILEGLIVLIVTGSALAIGAVHPWAYVPLLWVCLVLGLLAAARVLVVAGLVRSLGHGSFCLHPAGRFVEPKDEGSVGWSFDLTGPLLPRAPLVYPGLAFCALVGLQLLPLRSGRPLTVAPADTLRGLAFVASALAVHVTAALVLSRRSAAARFERFVSLLAVVLTAIGLAQMAAGERRIYGFFEPWEGGGSAIFATFVNRNHFAGYLLLLTPLCLATLAHALRGYARRVGLRPNLRRLLVALEAREGTALLYASVPAAFCIGALLATTSRGGIVAFLFGLALAGVGLRRQRGVPPWLLAVAFGAMALAWFGIERLEVRFASSHDDAPGRTEVWKDAARRMDGLWLTGSGFNTFGHQMSHVAAWKLPQGATPWPEDVRALLESGARVGTRAPEGTEGLAWYREAHNDYLQLLVEAGLPGLLLGLLGAGSVLAAARFDPWRLSALAGLLLHELVDFDLQIPAVAVLFVVVAAATRPGERKRKRNQDTPAGPGHFKAAQ